MGITSYLKVIGRGAKGAGDLDREQAKDIFSQILSGKVSDLELGAFCLAMRIKGESVPELLGFMDALQPEIQKLNLASRPCIILPSYNGARKQANLSPLLAGMLSNLGFTVIVHGIEKDPTRVTSYEIFEALDWPILKSQNGYGDILQTDDPIFCPLKVISPALQKLLDVRKQIGLRNTGHVLAKLINPVNQNALQISNYTHPEYPEKLREYFQLSLSNAILMRGSEGEPTASQQRLPEMHFLFANKKEKISPEEKFQESNHFVKIDAKSTALVTKDILSGKIPFPTSIMKQANTIASMAGII